MSQHNTQQVVFGSWMNQCFKLIIWGKIVEFKIVVQLNELVMFVHDT